MVRQAAEWFNERDVGAFLGLFDEDAEWIEDQRYPGAETFRGPTGVERSLRKWWDAWAALAMYVDEAIDLGDCVVVAGHVEARGHDSEVAVEAPFGGVYEFRDGKVIRVRVLGSREEALEAAGPPA